MKTVSDIASSEITAHAVFDRAIGPHSDQATITETKMVNEVELLPLGFREVIVMREMEEMSYREIAGVAGLPIGTVMSRLSRARKRLEACVTGRMKGGSE
jgi:DNA-directed RNA polymerase specialized sigma24 family protein